MSCSQPASQPDSIDLAYDMWAGQFEFVGPTAASATNATTDISKEVLINSASQQQKQRNHSAESVEDLNLNFNTTTTSTPLTSSHHQHSASLHSSICSTATSLSSATNLNDSYLFNCGKQPILIEQQEPFLSLNPADFDEVIDDDDDIDADHNDNVSDDIVPLSGPNSMIYIQNPLKHDKNNNSNSNKNSRIDKNGNSSDTISEDLSNDLNINRKQLERGTRQHHHHHHHTLNASSDDDIDEGVNSDDVFNNSDNENNRYDLLKSSRNCNKLMNNQNNKTTKLENYKNLKNKLFTTPMNADENNMQQQHNDNVFNNNSKLNGLMANEICENLNEQLELLQRQVTDLADTQNSSEDRTARTKTEYAVLQARYHMLEEQYREGELRAEERLAEEQKRNRELLARVEREATLQNENCQIKIKTIETERNAAHDEAKRLRVLYDKQAHDLHRTQENLELARDQIVALQEELDEEKQIKRKYEEEKKATEELMLELSKELERLRAETGPALPTTSPETIRLEELHQELEEMRQKNKALEEQNEELQAVVLTRGVEEGRHLLNGTLNSLAQELEEMSQAQASTDSETLASFNELQKAFQEKEEENTRLKHYIDTILLNIVENYPQLLEVKPVQQQPAPQQQKIQPQQQQQQ